MKSTSTSLISIAALAVALSPSAVVVANAQAAQTLISEDADATTISHEELASYGLTLDEFNSIRSTESPVDFGGLPSSGDTDQLWLDAAAFEYDVATSHGVKKALTSVGYHPYVVCSTHPDMTGNERSEYINGLFENTPDVNVVHWYPSGNIFYNKGNTSCGVIRTFDDTISKVYSANINATEHMSVSPMHPSMKMVENTVEVLEAWFEGKDPGNVVSIGTASDDDQIKVNVMGLKMILCPGVQEFAITDVPDDEIASEIKNFVMEDGGDTVKSSSFYHHRVSGMDGDDALHTERMDQWSHAVTKVTDWTMEDGSNACLDSIIDDNMIFRVTGEVLEVDAKLSFTEGYSLGLEIGMSEDDIHTCIWYLTYALGVCPMVCSVQPETEIRTLCKDGTSDLSKCPTASEPINSSGRFGLEAWLVNGVSLVSFFASFGVALL